jgi:hypothetical protein
LTGQFYDPLILGLCGSHSTAAILTPKLFV